MTKNQRTLHRLYKARYAELMAKVPDGTIRRHIKLGRVGNHETLSFYATLGMPVDAWPKRPRKKVKREHA